MKKIKTTIAGNNPVSEKFLDVRLQVYATKIDLKTEIALFGIEVDEKLERLDEKNRGYRDEILTKIDSFAKRIVDLKDEEEVGTYQIDRLKGKVDDHNKRITKLETKN